MTISMPLPPPNPWICVSSSGTRRLVADSLPVRRAPMASNSSMNIMASPSARAVSNRFLILRSASPNHLLTMSEQRTE